MNNQIIGYLSSRNPKNIDILKILDYGVVENSGEVTITFLYKNIRYTKNVETIITDKYDYPINTGERYIVINNFVYFIDDIKDVAGIWNYSLESED